MPAGFAPSSGWMRCVAALEAVCDGYGRFAGKRHKTTLVSNFVAHSPQKAHVDTLIAQHVQRCFTDLGAMLSADPSLIVLLLDAPDCGTSGALLEAMPSLAAHSSRICIPQADPAHYGAQVSGENACSVTALHHFNVRCQRLDQWLVSNRHSGLHACIFFADWETSIYGKPKAAFSPLRDLQLFAHSHCLLGVTLSFREPHGSRYAATAPQLTVDDLTGFVASEAEAVGLTATLVETVRYGLTFCLYELVAAGAHTA